MQTNDQFKRGRSPGYSAEIAEAICDRQRLQIKALRWIAARMTPRKYGTQ
jgi:hypothetical protein